MIDSATAGDAGSIPAASIYKLDFDMAGELDIDARGFNSMIRELKKINKAAAKPVVRAVTKDVLASAAKKTKKASAKSINASVEKNFRKPFEVAGKGFVGITKSGKVWVNLASWGDKSKWALLHTDGKLKNVPGEVKRTGRYKPGSNVNLGRKNKSEINAMIRAGKAFMQREKKYRKSIAGLSKASWYHLLRTLKLGIPAGAPAYATKMKVPREAAKALRAWEAIRGRDNFTITIYNAVQACLNPNAKGIGAFRLALNGQVRNFKTRMAKDSKAYAKQFAAKHGFTVK